MVVVVGAGGACPVLQMHHPTSYQFTILMVRKPMHKNTWLYLQLIPPKIIVFILFIDCRVSYS